MFSEGIVDLVVHFWCFDAVVLKTVLVPSTLVYLVDLPPRRVVPKTRGSWPFRID